MSGDTDVQFSFGGDFEVDLALNFSLPTDVSTAPVTAGGLDGAPAVDPAPTVDPTPAVDTATAAPAAESGENSIFLGDSYQPIFDPGWGIA